MKNKISVAFSSQKLKHEFDSLKSGKFEDKELYGFIDRALDDLKKNPSCGTKFIKDYGQRNTKRSMESKHPSRN